MVIMSSKLKHKTKLQASIAAVLATPKALLIKNNLLAGIGENKKAPVAEIVYSSVEQWKEAGIKLYGPNLKDWVFICPCCKNKQTIADFVAAGLTEPDLKLYTECLSKYVAGRINCHYKTNQLFQLSRTAYIGEHGLNVWVFDFDK